MNTLRTTILTYRQHAKGILLFNELAFGSVYVEFKETWERVNGAPAGTKLRVLQKETGRKFRLIDHVTHELLEDDKRERMFSKKCLLLTVPSDFTYLRLLRCD